MITSLTVRCWHDLLLLYSLFILCCFPLILCCSCSSCMISFGKQKYLYFFLLWSRLFLQSYWVLLLLFVSLHDSLVVPMSFEPLFGYSFSTVTSPSHVCSFQSMDLLVVSSVCKSRVLQLPFIVHDNLVEHQRKNTDKRFLWDNEFGSSFDEQRLILLRDN